MLALILISIALILFYIYAIRPMSYWRTRRVNQTNPMWLFGDSAGQLFRTCSFSNLIEQIYNIDPNARYIGFYQFTQPTLLIKDPKLIKQITVRDFEYFTDHRQFIPTEADPFWNRNLLALRGKDWKEMRPILSPSYTSNKMKMIFTLMNECGENFVNFFLKKDQNLIDVKMKDISTHYSNDVIATTAFGVEVNSMEEPNNEFYLMGKHLTDTANFMKTLKIAVSSLYKDLYKFVNIQFFDDPSRTFFASLIENTIKVRKEQNIIRPDMIHLLMEAQKEVQQKYENSAMDDGFPSAKKGISITNVDIIAQAMIFFFAGFESTSSLITFMAYELAVNPDIQERLKNEIQASLKEFKGKLSYETLFKMKYLDMVVSETLRKWPSFPGSDRVCNKRYIIEPELSNEKPVVLEEGVIVELPIVAMHYDEKYFPNPERFDPERFSEENKSQIDPYTYFPFGVGPRICIGSRFALMEAKVFFAHLLQHFQITATSATTIPIQLSKKHFNTYPSDSVHLAFKRCYK